MKKIRIVEIIFDNQIVAESLPAFRGAVATKVGHENVLFHNHLNDGYRFSYPLIQYKRINTNASILCIEEGVDEIYKLFEKSKWNILMNGQEIVLKIKSLKLNQYNLNVYDTVFSYTIRNWIGLNDDNYKTYKQLQTQEEKNAFLERILVGNILSFAKGIGWTIEKDKQVRVKVITIDKQRTKKFKNLYKTMLDMTIKTNVYLPPHIGLGKSSSMGYGVVYKFYNKKKQMNDLIANNKSSNQ